MVFTLTVDVLSKNLKHAMRKRSVCLNTKGKLETLQNLEGVFFFKYTFADRYGGSCQGDKCPSANVGYNTLSLTKNSSLFRRIQLSRNKGEITAPQKK